MNAYLKSALLVVAVLAVVYRVEPVRKIVTGA